MAIVMLLDPLGVGIVSSTDGDLCGDAPVVVLVPDRTEREFKAAVSLVFKILDTVL